MPLRTAAKLCPQAVFLDCHHELFSEWSDHVAAVLGKFSPVVEMASIDEAYLDLAGTERLLREITATTGLPCSGGLAATRLVAKVASKQAKPRGLLWLPAGSEAGFLAPLRARRIPGIGRVTEEALRSLGIYTVGDLQRVERERLEKDFGRWGTALFRKAHGRDSHEFFVDAESKSQSLAFHSGLRVSNNSHPTDRGEPVQRVVKPAYPDFCSLRRARDSPLFAGFSTASDGAGTHGFGSRARALVPRPRTRHR